MKFGIRHAVAVGIVVVLGAFVYWRMQHGAELVVMSIPLTVGLCFAALLFTGGKCCIGKRCFGRSSDKEDVSWLSAFWF